MKKNNLALIFIFIIPSILLSSEYRNFNSSWKFAKGNHKNAEHLSYNDSSWNLVNIPHDWAIYGSFDPDGDPETAKLPWKDEAWYRKIFKVDKNLAGKRIFFLFDGVMAFPKIYINGKMAYEWDYGYNSFYFDATSFIKYGEDNVISVHVDTREHESRWYPGAGIYRKVRMIVADSIHASIWGTYISTPMVNKRNADIRTFTKICNETDVEESVVLQSNIIDPFGNTLLTKKDTIKFKGEYEFEQWFRVNSPDLWDVKNPNIYTIKSITSVNGRSVDTVVSKFGIRSIKFSANNGFFLNGERVKLKGVNLHHGQGPLGAAFNKRAMQRQLEIMKEMGCNAIRTSHNIPAPELLELCDEMGLLVINEAYDKWDERGDFLPENDFFESAHRNIKNFVLRDRNHPSIILWSIGNEMHDIQSNIPGSFQKLVSMTGYFRKYDPSRSLTMANDDMTSVKWHHDNLIDVHSWNYGRRYLSARLADTTKAVIISESASTVSTRGYYSFLLPKKKDDFDFTESQISSYDLNAPEWAEPAEQDFKWQEEDRFVAGEFVWTGFDYLGEPTPFNTSSVEKGIIKKEQTAKSSYFGIVDLCGIPKDRYFIYRSYWRPDVKTIHILPHWNWKGKEGEIIPVMVHTNADYGELFLNGKSLGLKYKIPNSENIFERYRLMWNDVKYETGELKVVVYKDGDYYGEEVIMTSDIPVSLRLTPDRTILKADTEDLSYILVEALDKDGNLCPIADNTVEFNVDGNARIAATGNGNPQSLHPFQSNKVKLFYGKAMLIIKSIKNKIGDCNVIASSQGLPDHQTNIKIEK